MNEIRLRVNGAVVSYDEFRNSIHPDKMLPAVLTPDILESLAADAVLVSPVPTPGLNQRVVRNGVVQDRLGNWVQSWEVQDIPADELLAMRTQERNNAWEAVKRERDGPRVNGGVKVHGAWFNTDMVSRTRWMSWKDSARDILASGGTMSSSVILDGAQIQCKLMDNTYAPVTVQLTFDVVQAIRELDANLFKTAENHHTALLNCDNPESYNYMVDWPEQYQA